MTNPIGNDRFLTDLDIRIWLRDNEPAANTLLDDYEFTPEELRTAITLAVDYWNETPPPLVTYDYPEFPFRFHLLKGTCANLLFIAANHYRRNFMQYNVPGASIAPMNKAPEYDAAGQKLWEEYKLWVAQKKRAMNIEQGFGTIG